LVITALTNGCILYINGGMVWKRALQDDFLELLRALSVKTFSNASNRQNIASSHMKHIRIGEQKTFNTNLIASI